jgi:hypothetical protein
MDRIIMSTNFKKQCHKTLTRRKILTAGSSILGLSLTASTSFAQIGSDSDRGKNQLTDYLDATQYSQAEIVNLSHKELTYLYNYRIVGFLDVMASNIVKMMLSDRASTRQLLQEMAEIDAKSDRKQRLLQEVSRTTALENNLMQSIARMKSGQGTGTARSLAAEKRQLRSARVYRRGVKSWARYPREGTYRSPFSLILRAEF